MQALQTTATFDSKTKEIVFHTPNDDAIKFWAGNLGVTATHAVVAARLITDGKDNGVQFFLIQVRDMESHKCLDGVFAGDIGPKIGLNLMDHGFMKFTNFRQPMSCLMSRYVELSPTGQFSIKNENAVKLGYGGMLALRINIIKSICYILGRQATIAARYSFRRRQFEGKDGSDYPETPVMLY